TPAAPRTVKNTAIQDMDLCNGAAGTSVERQIAACTELIEAHVTAPQSLAIVYNNRGIASARKGDYEQAIKDYDQSVKLDPTYSKAFNNRGIAYQKQGDHERALADFSTAIN